MRIAETPELALDFPVRVFYVPAAHTLTAATTRQRRRRYGLLGSCGRTSIMTASDQLPVRDERHLTAVILCGGRGERLRRLTDATPKPLLPANGRPILDYVLEHLMQSGIKEFILCTGYRADLFEQFAARRARSGMAVRCVNSGDVSIARRLAEARPLIRDRALVCYGDTLADVDVRQLLDAHQSRELEATLTVYPYRSPFGIVSIDESGLVSKFEEKPQLPYWINIGFLLLEPAALRRLDPAILLPEFLARLAGQRLLGVHRHQGRHWTANTETELRELAEELKTHWKNKDAYEVVRK
jgi:glucose-1-phosphate cytidylyltransferase